jgi:hypothetical protein
VHRRSSYVWEEDRANLEAHPDALGVASEAIADDRGRVAVGSAASSSDSPSSPTRAAACAHWTICSSNPP